MITKFNIAKPEKYMKDGVEKTYWANVGTMTEFVKQDGSVSRIIEIPAIGLKANVFAVEPRQTQPQATHTSPQQTQIQEDDSSPYPEEPINPEDIPF